MVCSTREWVVLCAAIVGGGACEAGSSEPRVCGLSANRAADAAFFAALTATDWRHADCSSTAPLPPTCHRVALNADGSFSWTAVSDVNERQQGGRWSFRARDDAHGIACLEDGSVVSVSLERGLLQWGVLGSLLPDRTLPASSLPTRLPSITVDPQYRDLVDRTWQKTDSQDLAFRPTSFVMHADGTFEASYRNGECATHGSFSLVYFGPKLYLSTRAATNTCDSRGGGAEIAGNDVLRIDHGALELPFASYTEVAAAK